MKKLKLVKSRPLEHREGYQTSVIEDNEKGYFDYKVNHILSDTPADTTSSTYPYSIEREYVIPHEVFNPLFTGSLPKLTKDEADRLFSTSIGYDKKSGLPCRIHRIDKKVIIEAFPQDALSYVLLEYLPEEVLS